MRRGTAAALALLAACGGGRAIAPSDLARILLRPGEAPRGTVFLRGDSGPLGLDRVRARWHLLVIDGLDRDIGDEESAGLLERVESDLRGFGFRGGYRALAAAPEEQGEPLSVAAESWLFADPGGAERAFDAYRDLLRGTGRAPTSVAGLGDEAIAQHGPTAGDFYLYGFAWRRGSAVVLVTAGGTRDYEHAMDRSQVRALAERIDARAA